MKIEWNSVEKGLPKEDGRYLCLFVDKEIDWFDIFSLIYQQEDAELLPKGWHRLGDPLDPYTDWNENMVAWMPLEMLYDAGGEL